ncbi:hypothetical protein CEP52_009442 [Fusarium oligoseptatum]|uniref:Uncharacterized protein n=1 Tax=Fusarium oligoseptatum TaxID=2604345 RepID=A0A428TD35_9HYPO|nr:hypothetical protein CEP52_009442 [Fusarium oligoseptatum]
MLPILISAKLWHQLRDIIWNDPSAMNRLDWKGMWRTWQVGEFEVRFDLYEDTKYDSTKAKVKRSVQKLQKALHRKL